jgi:ABC-type uncharacterized transport system ATPase subunit
MSDSVVLLHNGYVVAEGEVHGVRDEIDEHPILRPVEVVDDETLAWLVKWLVAPGGLFAKMLAGEMRLVVATTTTAARSLFRRLAMVLAFVFEFLGCIPCSLLRC